MLIDLWQGLTFVAIDFYFITKGVLAHGELAIFNVQKVFALRDCAFLPGRKVLDCKFIITADFSTVLPVHECYAQVVAGESKANIAKAEQHYTDE